MKIVLAASEVAPFSKTGGLADVAGSLPKSIRQQGHDITVFTPLYRSVNACGQRIKRTGIELQVPVGKRKMPAKLHRGRLPGSQVPVYFIESKAYFDRDGLYGTAGGSTDGDFPDNAERFIFFTRAILEACIRLDISPNVIHCNDWQTGLLPAYVRTTYADKPAFAGTATVYTVHNLGYQGKFWHWDMKLTGLDWYLFDWRHLEFYGDLNFMKGGIVFADVVSTVSKQYAKEIQTEEYGVGLHDVLAARSGDLFGIINGVDYETWNPQTDKLVPANYSPDDLTGKASCKAALQKDLRLPSKPDTPLIGIVSRLDKQKGCDLLAEVIGDMATLDLQIVILGTGDPKYHKLFQNMAEGHPTKIAAKLEYDNELAHRIEAGADMFLMPSLYEPCGLNQLYSLTYGTVPIVRSTGGLADTVKDATPEAIADGTATGFSFKQPAPASLLEAIHRALDAYTSPDDWQSIIQTCMKQDWSWSRSAEEYIDLYRVACANVSRRKLTTKHLGH